MFNAAPGGRGITRRSMHSAWARPGQSMYPSTASRIVRAIAFWAN